MTKKTINDYLKEAGVDSVKASWKLDEKKGGKTIVTHKALEQISDHLGMEFEKPVIINADYKTKPTTDRYGNAKVADDSNISMIIAGKWNDRSQWSTGEASPANSTNAYPWAIAEKRGKDRVILKLLRVHGEVYSELESEDFKRKAAGKPNTDAKTQYGQNIPYGNYSQQPVNPVVNNMPKFIAQPDLQDVGY